MSTDTMVEVDEELDTKTGKPKEEFIVVENKDDLGKNKEKDEDARGKSVEEEEDNTPDTDPEREAIRQRRRQEKLERKERREQAIARDKLEMDFLRKRNDDLERRIGNVEEQTHTQALADIDRQLGTAVQEAKMAEQVIAKAIAAGNGEDVTTAMRYRDQAIAKAQQLHGIKQQAGQRQEQQPQVDPRVLGHAQAFLGENKWYDPQGRDEDSAIVLAIDQGLMRDGFNPQTQEYWAELRKRAGRRLPERFSAVAGTDKPDDDEPQRKPRGGPAIGSGREQSSVNGKREIYISPERKQALVDAGVWDDPVLRQKYVKRYAEYDKNNRN